MKDDGKELSHQLKLKEVFACNDYFANSARMTAAGMIKSGQELAKLYIEDAKEDIKAIRKVLRKKKKSVSYTHLDVYKRQGEENDGKNYNRIKDLSKMQTFNGHQRRKNDMPKM